MTLDEQERVAAAAAKTRVSRLVYGEDVAAGMQVRQTFHDEAPKAQPGSGLVGIFGAMQCTCVDEWVVILEVRRYGDVCSAIAVREDGTQVPMQFHIGQLLDVASDGPA